MYFKISVIVSPNSSSAAGDQEISSTLTEILKYTRWPLGVLLIHAETTIHIGFDFHQRLGEPANAGPICF
ncbi:MAG: hypothetical protein R2788_26730 [Saprospiraceae bacterium]